MYWLHQICLQNRGNISPGNTNLSGCENQGRYKNSGAFTNHKKLRSPSQRKEDQNTKTQTSEDTKKTQGKTPEK